MKSLKSLFSIMLVAVVLAFASCSKSSDPTPATPKKFTAKDSVDTSLSGTWSFASLTLTQIANGKSKTISTCDKSSMDNYYSDANWSNYTAEFNWLYNGGTSVTGSNACVSASAKFTVSTVLNSDGSVNITFNGGGTAIQVYKVKPKDITSTTVKAIMVSDGNAVAATQGYLPVFTFKRS